jgi:hypothetical protein
MAIKTLVREGDCDETIVKYLERKNVRIKT